MLSSIGISDLKFKSRLTKVFLQVIRLLVWLKAILLDVLSVIDQTLFFMDLEPYSALLKYYEIASSIGMTVHFEGQTLLAIPLNVPEINLFKHHSSGVLNIVAFPEIKFWLTVLLLNKILQRFKYDASLQTNFTNVRKMNNFRKISNNN